MINDKEYNFNEVSQDILRSIQKFKQASLLNRSLLKCQHSLTKDILEISSIDHDGIIREQFRQRLAQQIIGVTEEHIQTEDYGDARVYSLEVLIFALEDLKHIVEYCVKEMPMESINKIKNQK